MASMAFGPTWTSTALPALSQAERQETVRQETMLVGSCTFSTTINKHGLLAHGLLSLSLAQGRESGASPSWSERHTSHLCNSLSANSTLNHWFGYISGCRRFQYRVLRRAKYLLRDSRSHGSTILFRTA